MASPVNASSAEDESTEMQGIGAHSSESEIRQPELGIEEREEEEELEGITYDVIRDKPCRVHDIILSGNNRTKDWIILKELEDVRKAETFDDLQRALAHAWKELNRLGIFERVDITCDEGPSELPGTANVIVEVKESSGVLLNVGTYVQGREQSVEGSAKLKNFLGYCEMLDVNAARGDAYSSSYSVGVELPFVGQLPAQVNLRAARMWRDWQRRSSHTQQLRGATLTVRSGGHEAGYELTWRDNRDGSGLASGAIRRQLGHSLLSALKYSYTVERRDSLLRPTRGWAFRSTSELAGVGADRHLVRYFKQEVDMRGAIPLGIAGAALTAGVTAGFLLPWGTTGRAPLINDRFFLGGPSSLRAFRRHGIGPSAARALPGEGRDALGGDVFVTAAAALSFDLPVFAAAGNLTSLREAVAAPPAAAVRSFVDGMRVSVGAGLVLPTTLGRLEVEQVDRLVETRSTEGLSQALSSAVDSFRGRRHLDADKRRQREKDRERAAARAGKGGKKAEDGMTPDQRRERDAKALQEKLAKKASAGTSDQSIAKK
eukprot:jgi/Mesen1/1581/ME000134S00703